MKAIARTSLLTTGLLTLATSAFAAGSASGGSGLLVWLFLGFFGLIVATQLVPAVMLTHYARVPGPRQVPERAARR